jgi:hypothetical protein
MIAPPQVQAHNLANAIRTDIVIHSCSSSSFCSGHVSRHHRPGSFLPAHNNAKEQININAVNPDYDR